MYLSGNGFYWRIAYRDAAERSKCGAAKTGHARGTLRWRILP